VSRRSIIFQRIWLRDVWFGSKALVRTTSADRPVYPPLPTSCRTAVNRRLGPEAVVEASSPCAGHTVKSYGLLSCTGVCRSPQHFRCSVQCPRRAGHHSIHHRQHGGNYADCVATVAPRAEYYACRNGRILLCRAGKSGGRGCKSGTLPRGYPSRDRRSHPSITVAVLL
jgi:hypothetical protein